MQMGIYQILLIQSEPTRFQDTKSSQLVPPQRLTASNSHNLSPTNADVIFVWLNHPGFELGRTH
ncbi:hypothetical protein AKJ16_DCAP12452 [Drosera capensis]